MKYTKWSEKDNTLYIYSDHLLPDTTGMSWKEHSRAYKEAFAMSYQDRLEKFCKNPEVKKEIKAEIEAHKDCKLSEFTYA